MYQTWSCLAFLHWSYEPRVLARLLPGRLRPHLRRRAWVGLTPFLLEGLRTPVAPVPPWFARFPETNVRTYVVGPDDGLWSFSLDAARLEPVLVAGGADPDRQAVAAGAGPDPGGHRPASAPSGVSAMRSSWTTRPSGYSDGASRPSSSTSPRLPSIRS
jgi:hypothetical protein